MGQKLFAKDHGRDPLRAVQDPSRTPPDPVQGSGRVRTYRAISSALLAVDVPYLGCWLVAAGIGGDQKFAVACSLARTGPSCRGCRRTAPSSDEIGMN
jgi:hypothetical protein